MVSRTTLAIMPDIKTQLPVKVTNGTSIASVTAGSALLVDGSAVTQPVSGTLTVVPSGTQVITGTVATVPTSSAQAIVGTVTIANLPGLQQVTNISPTTTNSITVGGLTTVSRMTAPTLASLGSVAAAGSIAYYNGSLYYSNGTAWRRSSGAYTGIVF